MKADEFEEMLKSMAQAWTERDYTKVANFFNENLFYSDSLSYCLTNKKTLLEFFENDDGLAQKCVFHNKVFDESKQIGAAEYTYQGTHRYHGTVWVEIENKKIQSWREYQHISQKNWTEFWSR